MSELHPGRDDISGLKGDADKIDDTATDGLLGTVNSLSYRVHEIETHLHSFERWFETASAPSGETHIADRIGSGGGSFQIDAGNNTWGNWLQILGSSDTPVVGTNAYYDLHKVQIEAAERTATYFIQIAFGASGATALTNNTYAEFVFEPQSVQGKPSSIIIQAERQAAGTKVWARCKCPSQDTATLNLFFGLHEYEG